MSQISPGYAGLEKYINELRNQVSSLKVELREICAAIDDPAGDLTLTTVECIKKLKAENESLRKDAERYRWLRSRLDSKDISIIHMRNDINPEFDDEVDTATDAAMAQGEQGC